MAIKLSLPNVLTFAGVISPFLISFYFIFDSIFNGHPKGFIWLFGILLSQFFVVLLKGSGMMKWSIRPWLKGPNKTPPEPTRPNPRMHDLCSTFEDWNNKEFGAPSTHLAFHWFTIMYIILGLAQTTPVKVEGIGFLITLLVISFIDMGFRKVNGCETIKDQIVGALFGGIMGGLWYMLVTFVWPGPQYTYYGPESNMKRCKLSKQSFKCSYKN
jgi:hypothetical protein